MHHFKAKSVENLNCYATFRNVLETNYMPFKTGYPNLSFFVFLSLYTARPSFEDYRQVNFVHSGLQNESLQVTI